MENAAGVCAISGQDIDVQGPQAKRTMVARGIAQRFNLTTAMSADKACVVFGESFVFQLHVCLPFVLMLSLYHRKIGLSLDNLQEK